MPAAVHLSLIHIYAHSVFSVDLHNVIVKDDADKLQVLAAVSYTHLDVYKRQNVKILDASIFPEEKKPEAASADQTEPAASEDKKN